MPLLPKKPDFNINEMHKLLDGKMYSKVDFCAKRIAPSIDDIYTALKKKKVVCTDRTMKYIVLAFSKEITLERFHFGKLSQQAINDAVLEGLEFIEYGVFQIPYPVCFYQTSLDIDGKGTEVVGESFLLVAAEDGKRLGVVQFIQSGDDIVAIQCVARLEIQHDPASNMQRALPLELPYEEARFWEKRIALESGRTPNPQELVDGGFAAVGLTMILNTKGIVKERKAPPEKPNKARAARGLPLLPYTTYVHTNVYSRAVEPGTGTHSSPRPHRRRAHVRVYRNEDGSIKKRMPIAAMLVNWDGKPLERGQYEVKS